MKMTIEQKANILVAQTNERHADWCSDSSYSVALLFVLVVRG